VPNITNITPPRVPLTDSRTGLIATEWYLFFLSLFNQTGQSTVSLEDVQKGPASTFDPSSLDAAVQGLQTSVAPPFDPSNLTVAIQALETAAAVNAAAVDVLASEVQALALVPPQTPQLERLRYGSFYDTTDQTAAVINTAYAMTFNSTDLSQGVYIGSPTSRVYVDTANVYNIQFSAQLLNGAGGAHNAWIWLRKNGTDLANSATTVRVQGNNTELVAAWNFLLSMNAGDYFELMWEVSDTSVSLFHDAATAVHPAIPSIILTVTDNISA
jgi:hypothetical protein